MYNAKILLQQRQADAYEIAQQQPTPHEQSCKVKEDQAELSIRGSEALHHGNEVRTFKDDDEQSGRHREQRKANHECKNDIDIGVEQGQPGEDSGIEFPDVMGGISCRVTILGTVHLGGDLGRDRLQLFEVIYQHFGTGALATIPPCQPLYSPQVGEDPSVVELIEMGLINAHDLIAARTNVVRKEIRIDAVADAETEFPRDDARDGDLIVSRVGLKTRQASLHQMTGKEGRIVFLGHTTQGDALESLIGLEHPCLSGKTLDVSNAWFVGEAEHQQAIDHNRLRLRTIEALVINDLHMSAEADDLIAYLTLEAQDDTHRNDHHSQSHGNAPHSNRDGRTRDASCVVTMAKEAMSYGKFKSQRLLIKSLMPRSAKC